MTGQDNGKISPYLKLMADRKIIDKTSKTQRGGIYTITDPLFRLYGCKLMYNFCFGE